MSKHEKTRCPGWEVARFGEATKTDIGTSRSRHCEVQPVRFVKSSADFVMLLPVFLVSAMISPFSAFAPWSRLSEVSRRQSRWPSSAVAREGRPDQTRKYWEKAVQIAVICSSEIRQSGLRSFADLFSLNRSKCGSPGRDFPTVVDKFCLHVKVSPCRPLLAASQNVATSQWLDLLPKTFHQQMCSGLKSRDDGGQYLALGQNLEKATELL